MKYFKKNSVIELNWIIANYYLIVFILILLIYLSPLFSQDSSVFSLVDTSSTDSNFVQRFDLFNNDTINLLIDFTTGRKIPTNAISMPKAPSSLLEIDNRSGSYYTPRNVQDKIDRIMNRPRSDTFMPVFGIVAFAASIAKQLGISKPFELKAEDYFVDENEWLILEKLWDKSPQKITGLYLDSSLKKNNTAAKLQEIVLSLAGKGLIKTREESDKTVLFFPAQNKNKVEEIFILALTDKTNTDELQKKLNDYYLKLTTAETKSIQKQEIELIK
jgi:predicted transcriptional regulator